ncbi:MAG: hypothetical protein QOI69_3521 [Pseudonocardiales bacterium]|jgi:hypothetical protein|nr:hypothetical protein [Pseudonocardiales bacterium]
MSTLARVPGLRRARHAVRTRASEHPSVYLPFARRKYPGPSPEVLSAQTELVIDGYTRSASTFAVYALQLAQERPTRLAHHLHAPAQLIAAAHGGVPALLLIREPRGAILSQLVREPGVAIRDALVAYVRFHECLLAYQDRFVVGEFETVTHDFGSVIGRLNDRFGLTLAEFVHTAQSMSECFALIAQRGSLSPVLLGFESGTVPKEAALSELQVLQSRSASGRLREAWMPSAERQRAKAELSEQWLRPGLARLRSRAVDLYDEFVESDPSVAAATHDPASTKSIREGA